jgi:hypothetical protein
MDEAHIEHAIRFIEDELVDAAEFDGLLAEVIEQTSRRRNDDIEPRSDRAQLAGEARTPEYGSRANRRGSTVLSDARMNLQRQLPSGHQNQDSRARRWFDTLVAIH